uniref:tRNA methyltransferase 10 homolog C n=1 Tax=Scatophagus argus TaxID=75038 RepID=UPI001ED7E620|nr:tRNA methyltransferase 10 homolog C [Scatophagus argus]
MLRLVSTHAFHELWKCGHLMASCVTKKKVIPVLPVGSAYHHRLCIPDRLFSTGSPVLNDALKPKTDKSEDIQTIDLDSWKSVMRSQATSEQKQQINDEEDASDDDEILNEPGGEVKDSSLLDATRDLVIMWRQAGRLVPEEMTDEEVEELAKLTSKSSKKKYLKFLAIKEGHKRARKEKQQKRKQERAASLEQNRRDAEERDDQSQPEYKNTLFLQYWNRSLDKLLAWRSAQAMVFGQSLVFDMSYESKMSRQELRNTVSQLMEVEAWNRRATEPYHLHFCNLQPNGAYKQELLKRYTSETWDNLFITSTDQHHVDVFPHEQLVYLTADSPNVLHTYDHTKVYIIGAIVDRSSQGGLSLAHAKRLKLATARLPLDQYLHWELGAKNLTLDQMIRIMLTIKDTGKWEEALKFVPKRKIDGFLQEKTHKQITVGSGRHHQQSGFNSGHVKDRLVLSREKPAETRTRMSFKNSMDRRKGAGKSKMWWDDE